MATADLTVSRLKELLSYNPVDGLFTRIAPVCGRYGRIGFVCGSPDKKGHIYVTIDKQKHGAHRLAWFYTHGVWPTRQIDHINGVRADNRMANLRDVSHSINSQNRRKAYGLSGFLGVTKNKGKTFKAMLCVDGKNRYIGSYATPELAFEAYVFEKRKHHAGCTL